MTLPPGPRLPATAQTLMTYGGRMRAFPRLRARYGSTFTLRLLPGPQTVVLFSDPEDIRQIFAGDSWEFSGAGGNEVLRAAMGDQSVMLTDGQDHRALRRALMPAFSPRAVQGHRETVRRLVAAEVSGWRPGDRIDALDRMSAVTLDIMLHVVFGVTSADRLERLRPRVLRLVEVGPVVALGWLYPRLRGIPPWRAERRNLRQLDEIIAEELAARRTAAPSGARPEDGSRLDAGSGVGDSGAGSSGDDVLSMLIDAGLDDAQLRDQLITLVLAGYETTASALAWTLHELGRHDEVRRRARHAADVGDDDYLEACLKEAIRRHPIIDFVARTLRTEQHIGGWRIPAGVTVAPAIMLTQMDPQLVPDPEDFAPERFLDGTHDPGAWIPFGGGVRRCLGAAFAQMEGVEVLREVLRRVDPVADRPAGTRLRNITNVPRDGAPLRLRPR
ncbi:cytochrome P450 [Nesterenkonia sp. PF2B19]|uniref:cytochrome P450 n=1 Tax=Nesterenkonia sp. PF2B19 TaxID=1881858 RepID=UPI0008731F4D|nr:cytochrome P450 [Nesterenkonia sp. PF2B19]OSM43699.1 cytochrome P450 [Nesterenkonia sp. PF2B19]